MRSEGGKLLPFESGPKRSSGKSDRSGGEPDRPAAEIRGIRGSSGPGPIEGLEHVRGEIDRLAWSLGLKAEEVRHTELDLPSEEQDRLWELLRDHKETRFHTRDRSGDVIVGVLTEAEKGSQPREIFYSWRYSAHMADELEEELEALDYPRL